MSRAWERASFGPVLKGLLDRWQTLADDALFASTATNLDFFGGVVGPRGGSQLVTGWGAYVRGDVVSALTLTVVGVGPGVPGGGFQVGDAVLLEPPGVGPGGRIPRNVIGFDPVANQVSLDAPVTVPEGTAIVVRRPIPLFPAPAIRGIFPATFRDGVSLLIAAAGGLWWRISNTQAPVQITESYGQMDIAWTAGGLIATVSVTGSGVLGGFQVGDLLRIPGAGAGGTELITVIKTLNQGLGGFSMTVDPPATILTATTAFVYLLRPDPSVDEFGVMFANVLHLSSAHFQDVFYPPRKYEEQPNEIHRHGVVGSWFQVTVEAFQADPGPYPPGDLGPVPGDYKWAIVYRNSRTGQTSLPSPTMLTAVTVAPATDTQLRIYPSIDPQVDFIDIYRTLPGSGGVVGGDYYFVDSVVNTPLIQASILFTDKMRPAGPLILRIALDAIAPPETEQFIPWVHANRLIGIVQRKATQPGFIIYSDEPDLEQGYLKGESFPSVNMLFVNHDDGDVYTAVSVLFDSVVIFKRRSTWRIFGLPGVPPGIQIQPVHFQGNASGIGAVAPKLVVQDHDELLFPHDDGYYQLSRFSGVQSGFVSERFSLPIDNYFLGLQAADRSKGHAVFFRPMRQLRSWSDFNQGSVFQFDGPLTGEPMGWAMWQLIQDGTGTPARITASAVAVPVSGITNDFVDGAMPETVTYVGTEDGHILQLDYGTADYGGYAFPKKWESVEFAPAGRGIGARGRALDLRLTAYGRGLGSSASPRVQSLLTRVTTDLLVPPGYIEVPVTFTGSPSLFDGGVRPWRLRQTDVLPVQRLGSLVITPGQWHRLQFFDASLDTMWRMLGWDYWTQTLPVTQTTRRFLQSGLETLRSDG